MGDAPLTPERVLEAAEEVLRRFGPAKTTVVDVAKALGVSHGSVYRHFTSKAALRDAVAERWLGRISAPLTAIAYSPEPAPERLHRWLATLAETKQRLAREDPELFATYHSIAVGARGVVTAHVAMLAAQTSRMIADGISGGEFRAVDPARYGRAILDATARFHNPVHQAEWSDPEITTAFEAVWSLILDGLRPGVS
jgi:AcrR family transcriptional regulator